MWNIYDYLDRIKVRPWMFIGANKISVLRSHLDGYLWCLMEKSIEEKENPDFLNFNEWIKDYYWYFEATSWWANMILDKSKSEEDALKTFFKLIEKYKK